jgi:predicted metal-dependent HD superfamily phosphohydrolase
MNNIKLVEKYVFEYYKEFCDDRFAYHNLNHLKFVVKAVEQIGKGSNLKQKDIEILKIASWFHDIGHLTSNDDHEIISAKLAEFYLESIDYPTKKIDRIASCITATCLKNEPANNLEKIIRDADLSHLGGMNYFEHANNLFTEMLRRSICRCKQQDWIASNIKFFNEHNYYTDYAKRTFNDQKSKNLKKIISILK